jgi:hypothetical protein
LSAISNRDVKAPETVAAATDFLFDLLFALWRWWTFNTLIRYAWIGLDH